MNQIPAEPAKRTNYVQLVWNIAETLRGDFRPHQYGAITLPFVVLRRLECVLEPSRQAVLDAQEKIPKGADDPIREKLLNRASKKRFHNTTQWTLEKLNQLNKSRMDFAGKFEELIESYNSGSRSIEEVFEELLKLSRSLNEEEQRSVREGLSEEELAVFDILTRPAPELSTEERAEVKKVARELLGRVQSLLVLNWRDKAAARAQVKLAIEDALDSGLPTAYDKPLYESKVRALFEHVYTTSSAA